MSSDLDLSARIEAAKRSGDLLPASARNLRALLAGAISDIYARSVSELVADGRWDELNDRFYQTLKFGTGGLRGRTIGKVVTAAERGTPDPLGRPEFPCVGTNAMNFYNIARATRGLVAYLHEWRKREKLLGRPKFVIAHDTRHFSRDFAALSAKVASEHGCDAVVFEGPRSTPELSFAVRHLNASAGVVITASHNPPHDNGFKVYFNDGAQVVEPHASGIINRVNAIVGEAYELLVAAERGRIESLGREIDDAYLERLATLILDPALVKSQRDLRIVFTPIHGTGGVIIKPLLQRLGFALDVVAAQDEFDGRFPTVKSPNPENAEALQLGIEQAQRDGADLVIATDPDCDRMGVAVRTRAGDMKLLTGNQIGSLMAYYRAKTLFGRGILDRANASRGVIIKTFVTTDLQKAIAEHFGLRCVETLTGFKYIGAKLGKYEGALGLAHSTEGRAPDRPRTCRSISLQDGAARRPYHEMSEDETRAARLSSSSFYIFGGEESYGYSGADFVRDKDGNGATAMFCEVAAFAKSKDQTLDELLDEVFKTFGYFEEKNTSLTFEGADGAARISRLLESYVAAPASEMLGRKVVAIMNFERDTIHDVEGDLIPKEKMLIFQLEDQTRIAVRGSGTEPKIKFYLFGQRRPAGSPFTDQELAECKNNIGARLDALWNWLHADAEARAAR